MDQVNPIRFAYSRRCWIALTVAGVAEADARTGAIVDTKKLDIF